MSMFVTASTLVILGLIVILPVLKLHEELELVADSISQDRADRQFHSMLTLRSDELGNVITVFNQVYTRIIKEISERKHAEIIIQVVARVIEIKKFIYDLWGDAVNFASRMEPHSLADHLQVSDSTYVVLKNKYNFAARVKIMIKGKGDMQTYFLINKIIN